MNAAEMVGSVLYNCGDPDASSRSLLRILLDVSTDRAQVRAQGLDPDLVDVLRRALPADPASIALACSNGLAWVMGRRSVEKADSWELVVTLPPSVPLPGGVNRGTAETLTALITSARNRVRIAVPFIDDIGIGYLVGPIAAATLRGVQVDLITPAYSDIADTAMRLIHESVRREGDSTHLSILSVIAPYPWPHLKVLLVDTAAAYIGSANITGPGLAGRNLELGVLVRGDQVATIDRVLNIIPVKEWRFAAGTER